MRLITLLFTLFFISLANSGQVYKWTDENGQTHFSQFPPSNEDAAQINVNAPVSKNATSANEKLQKMRQKLNEQAVDRVTESEDEKQAAKDAEIKAENCKLAQQQLREYQNNGRIFRTLENGEREWYDEKGRANLIAKAQKQVDKYCN